MRTRLLAVTLFLLLSPFVLAQDLPDNAHDLPISHLLTLASTALSSGKSASALSIYDHILERDPTDFSTLYKRATIRLATGQLVKAKDGFRAVLAVRDFDQAHLELARIHAKLGEYAEALAEVDVFLKMHKPKEGGKDEPDAKALKSQIKAAQRELAAAQKAHSASPPQLEACVASATAAITVSPNSEVLRLLRADCYLLGHDFEATIGDLSRASSLTPSLPPHLLLRIALLSSLFIDHGIEIPPDSLGALKRCLSSDPDSKACRGAFKALKAAEKDLSRLRNWIESGRWTEVAVILAPGSTKPGLIKTLKDLVETYQRPGLAGLDADSPTVLPAWTNMQSESPLISILLSNLCRAYGSIGQARKAASVCEEVLERNPEDLWGLVAKGDRLLAEEEYEEAVRVLSGAFENTGRSDRTILEKLQKAQRLLKQSTAKDYYKVLAVPRDADAKAIKKAYRKATLKSHPDKPGGSETKMASINEAYEVLSNPELRARFDNGEDPNDPSAQQGGPNPFGQQGGSPFQHFFQQGGGGGQQFFQQGGGFKVKFG